MSVHVVELVDGWWVAVDDDLEYAGPFPSYDDASAAAERVADLMAEP